MTISDNFLNAFGGVFRQILRITGVAQADIHIEKVKATAQHQTIHENEEDDHENSGDHDGTNIYAIGSLTKVLVALLMSVIVDKLSFSDEPEDEPYRRLQNLGRDPWDISFTTLFNTFSDTEMSLLPKTPSLRQVLLHYNSIPPMNWALLAPEGTSLMSADEFLNAAPRLTEFAHNPTDLNYNEYSNGNYILIGLLIKAIAPQKDTLEVLMKRHIFQPLGMTRTFMNRSELGDIPCAQPHAISATGQRELIDTPRYLADTIMTPAMGAYSCTRDIAILLRNLQNSIDRGESIFPRDLVMSLIKPEGLLDRTAKDAYSLCGISTALDRSIPGSKSINRLITSTIYSAYRLGLRFSGTDWGSVGAYYQAGAVNGYASCFYFMPKHGTFVIVLTNTSGFIDASDHISRFILQEIFDLKHTPSYRALLPPQLRLPDSRAKVDIPEMASGGADESRNILREWAIVDNREDMRGASPLQLDGTYHNHLTGLSIIIKRRGDRTIVNIMGAADTSRDIGLHRTGDLTFRLYPLNEARFTIDRYDPYGWRELAFNMIAEKDDHGNQIVARIERRVGYFLDQYIRL